ncbi:unnamed protein product [Allacma fusca]|uniref:Lysosome membrane protein 2 n=1 Tax=Allacma fusca TaxID=39272 RepID=A0A8J2J6L1_9HEXA|nr:unnamed protein product [Allacma fusca]
MKNRNPARSSILSAGPTVVTVTTTLLILSLIIFFILVPVLIRTLIVRETALVNGTDTWGKWTNVTIPILIKFYIFNVTNIEDAEVGGKFKLQEVGPYVWEEKRTKQIVAVDEDADTVTYREIVWYYFRRDLSIGSQEDTINIVNIPFLAAATLIYKVGFTSLADNVITFFANMDERFALRDVNIRELVFDGVELNVAYSTLADIGIVELPDEFHDGTFAFYNRKNGTPTNEFKINRGVKNYKDFGKIIEYDRQKELNFWTNHSLPAKAEQYCNKINGTDGSIFPPFVTKAQILDVFAIEICRSVHFKFEKDLNYKGIPSYQFKLPNGLLQGPEVNEDNRCFCADPGDDLANNCDLSGALRIFTCKKAIPVGLSLPHFLHASERLLQSVEGLSPDEDKHKTTIVLEPNSGAVLNIVKRIQIFTEFQRLPGITAFSNITKAFIPIFWLEERADPSDDYIADIRDRLVTPLEILKVLKPTVLGVLIFTLLSGLVMSYLRNTSEQLLLKLNIDVN